MVLRKIRRDGNSLVISIPPEEVARLGWIEGDHVEIYADEGANGLFVRQLKLPDQPDFVKLGMRVIQEDRELLERLDAYDREKGKLPEE